jgi:Ca2+-binding RTX toxin-like protein
MESIMPLSPWNAAQTVNSTTLNRQSESQITQLSNGNIVVTWVDYGSGDANIKFQIYDIAGNAIGVERSMGNESGNSVGKPNISPWLDEQGWFLISYLDATTNTFVVEYFDGNGDNQGFKNVTSPDISISSDDPPPVLQILPNDFFALFYTTNDFVSSTSNQDLVGRIVDPDGAILGPAFLVGAASGTDLAAAVTVDTNGDMIVTWANKEVSNGSTFEIYMRRFSSSGMPLTTIKQVNTVTDGDQNGTSVARLSNGSFVVTWFSLSTTTIGVADIRGQIIDANGNKIGAEFLAGTTQFGIQAHPDVVPLANGKFMVIYPTIAEPFDSVHAQVFNSNGTPTGADFLITDMGEDGISYPKAVVLSDGRVALTWGESNAAGNDTDIRLQILDPRDGYFVDAPDSNGSLADLAIYGNDGGNDFFYGRDGDDTIYGMRGNDTLFGETGNDALYGDKGDDILHGGDGNDRLYGGVGDDDIYGGAGDDTIFLGHGEDLADGGTGNDTVSYYARSTGAFINLNNQDLNAGAAQDHILVNIDRINGSDAAADTITGDSNANYLAGYGGVDSLNGDGGSDILRGGVGADILSGGTGADKFRYDAVNEGGDTISSLSTIDRFVFVRGAFGNLAGSSVDGIHFLSRLTGNEATTVDHRFIFDQSTDSLWYDADGNANGATSVMIADINSDTVLSNFYLQLI